MTDLNSEDFVCASLNGFMKNAGILGFIKAMKWISINQGNDSCRAGVNYFTEEQNLYIRKDFLLKNDLSGLYIQAMVGMLGKDTNYQSVLSQKDRLLQLVDGPDFQKEETQKEIKEIYDRFIKMLEKSSFKAGYTILARKNVPRIPTEEMIKDLKKEKDPALKKEKYLELWEILNQKDVRTILIFKELMYNRINLFMDNFGFYLPKMLSSDMGEIYKTEFVVPLQAMIQNTKAGKKRCIDCGVQVPEIKSITFMKDTSDDLARKKSYYWNLNPDAYLCPLCAFLYSFVPLGFSYIGRDAVFINNSSSIEALIKFDNSLNEHHNSDEEDKLSWFKLYNLFLDEKISSLAERTDNIQVILRENISRGGNSAPEYRMDNLDIQIIRQMNDCRQELAWIRNRFVKDQGEFIDLYKSVIEHLVEKKTLYPFITKLIQISLRNNTQTNYIFAVERIAVRCKGGRMAENNIKRAYAAKNLGYLMRNKLTENIKEKDKDNSLRGLVYQLLNAVSSGNRDSFMNLILRTYASEGMPVPDIFLSCFAGQEEFTEIAYAYILGLKADDKKPENDGTANEKENE